MNLEDIGRDEEIFKRLERCLIGVLDFDEEESRDILNTSLSFENLKLDSLKKYELAFEIEGKFGVTIPDEEILYFNSLTDYEQYIKKHLGK